MLAHDPVQMYNRYEAMKVGRLLDELNYAWFEDPIRTTDMDGLIELASALSLPLHVGEFCTRSRILRSTSARARWMWCV